MELILEGPFSLKHTLECGQFFRKHLKDGWYYVMTKDVLIRVKQDGNKLIYETSDGSNNTFIKHFFRLNDNLDRIIENINKDDTIGTAITNYQGLRIMRQDPWECLISYIISARNNIPSIERSIYNISRKFGNKVKLGNYEDYSFPTSEQLGRATLEDLQKCGLAFRAKHALATIKLVNEGFDIKKLQNNEYKKAKEELMKLMGVGEKVADCVCLFSLEKMQAFPVDVWIKRFMETKYLDGKKTSEKKIGEFARDYFGEYAGYAQEYLYHHSRHL